MKLKALLLRSALAISLSGVGSMALAHDPNPDQRIMATPEPVSDRAVEALMEALGMISMIAPAVNVPNGGMLVIESTAFGFDDTLASCSDAAGTVTRDGGEGVEKVYWPIEISFMETNLN